MTVFENLQFMAEIYSYPSASRRARIDEVLEKYHAIYLLDVPRLDERDLGVTNQRATPAAAPTSAVEPIAAERNCLRVVIVIAPGFLISRIL